MACWIALHLPYLALEIAASFTPADAQTTVVLAQSRVWQAGEAARAAGVQNGMRRGGVLALLPQARFHDRDEAAERVALEALALALLRFGPDVAIASPQCVLIDVAPSLRLFGGLASLAAQVFESAEALGHRASLGIAATAGAAALLARAARRVPARRCRCLSTRRRTRRRRHRGRCRPPCRRERRAARSRPGKPGRR
ncbi:hypothetical protein ACNHE5_07250 [Pandoraea pnomenusa]|uniref:Y-family DNA polymerase n=1 Tax=Pandoraea pnomenusa TaxID=93220 RepID=UPI003CEC6CC5